MQEGLWEGQQSVVLWGMDVDAPVPCNDLGGHPVEGPALSGHEAGGGHGLEPRQTKVRHLHRDRGTGVQGYRGTGVQGDTDCEGDHREEVVE